MRAEGLDDLEVTTLEWVDCYHPRRTSRTYYRHKTRVSEPDPAQPSLH